MNEYYVFVKEHNLAGWVQQDTVWADYKSAQAAAVRICQDYPCPSPAGFEVAIAESVNGEFPRRIRSLVNEEY